MHPAVLVGAGFLLGTAGIKAVKSEPVRKATVSVMAQCMRIKEDAATLVDEAKSEFDDMMSEASYEVEQDAKELPAKKSAAKKAAHK